MADLVLVAPAARKLADRTVSVLHEPLPDNPDRAWCDWPGPMTALPAGTIPARYSAPCSRCPLIKAARTTT